MEEAPFKVCPAESEINKYEMVVVTAREARRINDIARMQGRDLKARVSIVARKRFLTGLVKYRYEEAIQVPPQPPITRES